MGCGSCSSGGCSTGGCGRNGGCATGGCNKLNTFDWLKNMLPPDRTEVDNIYEVRFKNTRKAFYRNVNGLRLYNGDFVVVESDRGFDVGQLSLGGVMAELQMRKKGIKKKNNNDMPRIYRKANETDLELLQDLRSKEMTIVTTGRTIIRDLKLEMKLSDVEYQGDGTKAIFYYIADHRVDFRELIKLLAREFRIRVEMKQIGLRHEAALLGGIGACGRELCCSTWLTDFKTVSTSAARYQNISLNPMKISGLCGRLKCCLNYELDSYMDALRDFPKVEKLNTSKGTAVLQKTDIFKGVMWFSYPDETSWYPLEIAEVNQILEKNKKGESPESLAAILNEKNIKEAAETFDFVDVVGTNVPEVPDRTKRKKRRNKKRPPGARQKGTTQSKSGNNTRKTDTPSGQKENRQRKGQTKARKQTQGKSSQDNTKGQTRKEASKGSGRKPRGQRPAQEKKTANHPQNKNRRKPSSKRRPQNRNNRQKPKDDNKSS